MKYLFFAMAFILLFSSVFALSCAPSSASIGVIQGIEKVGAEGYSMALKDAYAFEDAEVQTTTLLLGETVFIEKYDDIVRDYFSSKSVVKPFDEERFFKSNVYISKGLFEGLGLEENQVIVVGPPFRVCGRKFVGLVKDKQIVRAAINSYGSFSFKGKKFSVDPGKEIFPCNSNFRSCKVNAKFSSAAESREIAIGKKTTIPETNLKIVLLDASIEKQFEWGFHHYASFIIDFENGPVMPLNEPRVPTENKGLFQPIIDYISSLVGFFLRLLISFFQ